MEGGGPAAAADLDDVEVGGTGAADVDGDGLHHGTLSKGPDLHRHRGAEHEGLTLELEVAQDLRGWKETGVCRFEVRLEAEDPSPGLFSPPLPVPVSPSLSFLPLLSFPLSFPGLISSPPLYPPPPPPCPLPSPLPSWSALPGPALTPLSCPSTPLGRLPQSRDPPFCPPHPSRGT